MLPIKVVRVSGRISVQVGKQGQAGPPGPPDTSLHTKLTSEPGALLRILTDSQGRFALGVLNLDTEEYEAIAAVMIDGEPTLQIVNLP